MVDNIKIKLRLHRKRIPHSSGIMSNYTGEDTMLTANVYHPSVTPYMTSTTIAINNEGIIENNNTYVKWFSGTNDPMNFAFLPRTTINNEVWWDIEKVMQTQDYTVQRNIPSVLHFNTVLKPTKYNAYVKVNDQSENYITHEMSNGYFTGYTNQLKDPLKSDRFVRIDSWLFKTYATHYCISNIPAELTARTSTTLGYPGGGTSFAQYASLNDYMNDEKMNSFLIPQANRDTDPVVTIDYSFRIRYWGPLKDLNRNVTPDAYSANLMQANETMSAPVSPRNVVDPCFDYYGRCNLSDGDITEEENAKEEESSSNCPYSDFINPNIELVYDDDDVEEEPNPKKQKLEEN